MSTINTDIYNIVGITEQIKKNFMPDEDDDTLAVSTLGYISSIAADTMRESIRITSKMANETIYSKATLQSSIITHAMVLGIQGIFCTPAVMKAKLVIIEPDLLKIFGDKNEIIIDRFWKIMIDDYEFHLDYDIILTKTTISGNKNVYSARYETSIRNKLSNITNPYIDPPNTIIMDNNVTAIAFNVILRQTFYNTFYKKFITNNIIDNKTFMFTFENQLCDFVIKAKNGDTITTIEAVYEGLSPKTDIYCYYSFITSNKIRIKFDRTVYMPELNTEITIDIFTSLGTQGNFTYNTTFESFLVSEKFDYKNISALFIPITDSKNAIDQKSTSQLQALLPIEAASRGSIGNSDDLTAHFNLENTDNSRIIFEDKTINQFENSYYTYLALKDENNNMIPTNTIDVIVPFSEFDTINKSVGYSRYIIKQGCYILSDGKNSIVVKDPTYKQLKDAKFIYTIPLMCAVTDSQMSTSYYMSMMSDKYELVYEKINDQSNLQFVTTNIEWQRNYINEANNYRLSFQLTQNITSDMGIIVEKPILDEEGNPTGEVEVINNFKVIIILYKNGAAYRYKVANLYEYDLKNFTFQFDANFESADLINENNNIRINNVNIIGQGEDEFDYGYFEENTKVKIYVLYRSDIEYGRYDIDDYVPGLFGYSLSNIYSIDGGLYFFKNYSSTISSIVEYIKYDKKIPQEMDWNIYPLQENTGLYSYNGKFFIGYKVHKNCNVKLEIKNRETNTIYFKTEMNISEDTDDLNLLTYFKWCFRDFSTLKGTSFEGLHYDEDGNYIYYEGDEDISEHIKNISTSYIRIINEGTPLYITISSDTNYFTLEHIVTKENIDSILNNTEVYYDYNVRFYTEPDYEIESVDAYKISSMPVLRKSYLDTESKVKYIINMLNKKKDFIENTDSILESPFTIDIKFVNTYGLSKLYSLRNGDALDRVNLSLKFDLKLKQNADKNVVTYIIDDIKSYIESINKNLEDIHMKVIEDNIMKKYENAIIYIECMGINDYDQTINHLYLTQEGLKNKIPEFICINSSDTEETLPDIEITLV